MTRGKYITRHQYRIVVNCPCNDSEDHEFLDANDEQAPRALTPYMGLSSVMLQVQGGVPSLQDSITSKYWV